MGNRKESALAHEERKWEVGSQRPAAEGTNGKNQVSEH